MPHPVRLHAYDAEWPRAFERESRAVAAALADLGNVVEIAHVGSTAVPGLVAKPVIDLDVGVRRLLPGATYAERLAPLGYTWKEGAFAPRERELYLRRTGARGVHCHVLVHDGAEWRREIAFRDALRADPALREAYVRVKRAAAAKHPEDGERYAEEKAPFIDRVVGPPPT